MSDTPSEPNSVFIDLTTTANKKGVIRLAIFDCPEGLAAEEPVIGKVISFDDFDAGIIRTKLTGIPSSAFAIGAYHDLNNNGKLDRNLFGVPTEPYGFSGKMTSKWRAPEWEEVALTEIKDQQEIQLQLRYWKEM